MANIVRPLYCLRTALSHRVVTLTPIVANRPNPQKQKKFNQLPYASPSSPLDFQSRGLRLIPNPSDAQETGTASDSDLLDKKSRNQKKREARKAVKWGMDLAEFSATQITRILRAASLGDEVFNAIMTVKKFGPDVREGKRRQFNYIGRLLREVQSELLDELIQATKDGDQSKLQELSAAVADDIGEDDEDTEETECEEEDEGNFIVVASRWLDGLIDKDSDITKEVYSIHSVEFDRQELRKLVRGVQYIKYGGLSEDSEAEVEAALASAKKPLIRFLHILAKQMESD